jgi:hypothetical protein
MKFHENFKLKIFKKKSYEMLKMHNASQLWGFHDFIPFTAVHPDIDECKLDKDNCDKNAKCINTPGGFKCECKPGYSGNGVKCEGVNCIKQCEWVADEAKGRLCVCVLMFYSSSVKIRCILYSF